MASLRGNTEFLKSCRKIRDDGLAAIVDVNREQAQAVLNRAKELVPVKTGALRDSGKVTKSKTGGNIVFGDKNAPYAAYVHNQPQLQHDNGQAFFTYAAMGEAVEPTGKAWQTAFLRVIDANAKG